MCLFSLSYINIQNCLYYPPVAPESLQKQKNKKTLICKKFEWISFQRLQENTVTMDPNELTLSLRTKSVISHNEDFFSLPFSVILSSNSQRRRRRGEINEASSSSSISKRASFVGTLLRHNVKPCGCKMWLPARK